MTEQKTRTEEFQVQGEEILAKVKELVRQGNIRRISIRSEEGKPIVDIPLTLGVVGALLLPQFAALGAIAALVTRCTITVEKDEEEL
jgi:aryl-alcohol dehydrogenase-like predicted oxidoreductase